MEDGAHANTAVSRHDSGPASPVGKRSRGAALTAPMLGFAACAAAPSQQVWDVTTQQWCTPLAGRGGVRVRLRPPTKKQDGGCFLLLFVASAGMYNLYSCLPIRDPLRDAVHSSAAINPRSLPFFERIVLQRCFPSFFLARDPRPPGFSDRRDLDPRSLT